MVDRSALLALCHELGDPRRDLVVAAEGNVSARVDDTTMAIKASGCSLSSMGPDDLVDVDRPTLLALLGSVPTDEQTLVAYRSSLRSDTTRLPSVEAIVHSVLYEVTSANVIAHTHPTAVNSLTCSVNAHLLVDSPLFPDAVVMLGRRQVLVPYTDPGVPLAEAVRDAVLAFTESEGAAPTVVYLANHGVFVLAESPRQALQVTEMCAKNARILLGAIAAGGPVFLTDASADRIEGRPDEHHRRRVLKAE